MTNINRVKTIFKDLLLSTERYNAERLFEMIESSDFFEQEGQGIFAYPGGLAAQSVKLAKSLMLCGIEHDSAVAVGLLHDLAQAKHEEWNMYGGHGLKSLRIIYDCGMSLTRQEEDAIVEHSMPLRSAHQPLVQLTYKCEQTLVNGLSILLAA